MSGSRESSGENKRTEGADICLCMVSLGGLWILWRRMSNTRGFWGWSFSFCLDFITEFQSRQKGQENKKQNSIWGRGWEVFMYKARLFLECSVLPFYTTADAWKAVAWSLFHFFVVNPNFHLPCAHRVWLESKHSVLHACAKSISCWTNVINSEHVVLPYSIYWMPG